VIDRTVSNYRILEKIGEGGMGVVYLAEDLRLGRKVALKFLPAHLTADATEHARFLQEARAASALNHPNVCVIHDIQDHDGHPFIVMEWVEGETLGQRLRKGPLPVDAVLDWGIQIAEALQEAHARGVVHRDIKSDNVMITKKDQVKVMDFGLARMHGAARITREQTTTGTLAYMAPEQIRDGQADARSDVFSFGVLLYEMLAGQLPFRGEHDAGVMYSILHTEPEPITRWRPELFSDWQHLVDRALDKDPEARYQTASDLLIELKRMKRDSGKVSRADLPVGPPAGGTGRGATGTPPPARGSKLPLVAGLAVAALAAVAAYLWLGRQAPPRLNPNPNLRTLQVPLTQITYPGMSPDGRWIAFGAADPADTWDVYFMNVGGGEPRRVTSDSSAWVSYVDVSPDGSQIAYSAATGRGTAELRVVPSLGGASRKLADFSAGPRWHPDGTRIGYLLYGPATERRHLEIWSVRPDGSDARREVRDTLSGRGRISMSWSPDGRQLAWLRTMKDGSQEIVVKRMPDGPERQLTRDGKNIDEIAWTRQDEILYSSNRGGNTNLWMIRASGGPAVQVTRGGGPDIGMRISADGRTLLYVQSQEVSHLWLADLRTGSARQVTYEDMSIGGVELAEDGRRIAAVVLDPDPIRLASRAVVMDPDGRNRRPITPESGFIKHAGWSPGGNRWFAYLLTNGFSRGDTGSVFVMDGTTYSGARRVASGALAAYWSGPEEMHIEYRDRRLMTLDLATGREVAMPDSLYPVASPDGGHAILYDVRGGREGVYLRTPAAGPDSLARREKLADLNALAVPDAFAAWLFVVRPDEKPFFIDLPGRRRTPLAVAMPGLTQRSAVAILPDRSQMAYTDLELSAKLVLIENLR
jgi:Tol biopolymer transport system component/predicted Ser/Thr protein kinase